MCFNCIRHLDVVIHKAKEIRKQNYLSPFMAKHKLWKATLLSKEMTVGYESLWMTLWMDLCMHR